MVAAEIKKISTILTDDLELRKAVETCGLKPVGTVGVIINAYKTGLIGDAKTLDKVLNSLFDHSSLYISGIFKEFILEKVKEFE